LLQAQHITRKNSEKGWVKKMTYKK